VPGDAGTGVSADAAGDGEVAADRADEGVVIDLGAGFAARCGRAEAAA
jgi:hypothetical protein